MKKDVILINTARGGIVNEDSLFDFLKNYPKSFASFDVFEAEPAFDNKLLTLENFFDVLSTKAYLKLVPPISTKSEFPISRFLKLS